MDGLTTIVQLTYPSFRISLLYRVQPTQHRLHVSRSSLLFVPPSHLTQERVDLALLLTASKQQLPAHFSSQSYPCESGVLDLYESLLPILVATLNPKHINRVLTRIFGDPHILP